MDDRLRDHFHKVHERLRKRPCSNLLLESQLPSPDGLDLWEMFCAEECPMGWELYRDGDGQVPDDGVIFESEADAWSAAIVLRAHELAICPLSGGDLIPFDVHGYPLEHPA